MRTLLLAVLPLALAGCLLENYVGAKCNPDGGCRATGVTGLVCIDDHCLPGTGVDGGVGGGSELDGGGGGGTGGAGGSGGGGEPNGYGDGLSKGTAAENCLGVKAHDAGATSGPYWLAVTRDGGFAEIYCDFVSDDGGWMLVGSQGAIPPALLSGVWLVSPQTVQLVASNTIVPATFGCVDAVELAVSHATEIRLSNKNQTAWVKWPLPSGRTAQTLWRHAASFPAVAGAGSQSVIVTSADGGTATCVQNLYGISANPRAGGAYPATSAQANGINAGDLCMSVGVTPLRSNYDGFFHDAGDGFDAPMDDADWPNSAIGQSPSVQVWLR